MKSDPQAPVRSWMSHMPDAIFLVLLGVIATFMWNTERRLTRIETILSPPTSEPAEFAATR